MQITATKQLECTYLCRDSRIQLILPSFNRIDLNLTTYSTLVVP